MGTPEPAFVVFRIDRRSCSAPTRFRFGSAALAVVYRRRFRYRAGKGRIKTPSLFSRRSIVIR